MAKCIRFLLPFLLAASSIYASVPTWWGDPGTQILEDPGDPGAVADNYAPLNLGQLKHVAVQAQAHLDEYLPGGAGFSIADSWSDIPVEENYAPANVGQLKAIAKPFYDRLIQAGYDTRQNLIARGYPSGWAYDYPWPDDGSVPTADNYAPANIGQLKLIFSFDVSDVDSDGDGLPDSWEMQYFGTLDVDPFDDPDVDEYPNIYEFLFGFDPNDPSPPPTSDLYFADFSGDGIGSGWKLENGLDPFGDYTGLSPDGSTLTYSELWQLSLEGGNDPADANVAGLIVYTP